MHRIHSSRPVYSTVSLILYVSVAFCSVVGIGSWCFHGTLLYEMQVYSLPVMCILSD